MSTPRTTASDNQQIYSSIMQGLHELDLRGPYTAGVLVLTGDHAFPLLMNTQGKVLMAASLYGRGRMVVLGHEGYLTAFPALVENAISWLRGDGSDNLSVGVHQNCKAVADNLGRSIFQSQVVGGFHQELGVGVYVTDAYSVAPDVKGLEEFLKAGGGVLIAGQAWHWAGSKENALQVFPGNEVSSLAGIYFSDHYVARECLPIYPPIPCCGQSVPINFASDLEFLLEGVSEFNIMGEGVLSEVLVHGQMAFPIGTTQNRQCFLAGAFYGRGRVIVVSHESYFGQKDLLPFWNNALRWLDQGRSGLIGVPSSMSHLLPLYSQSGLSCTETDLTEELSVFVCDAYSDEHVQEIQDFVMGGGGLLIGGHAWYWTYVHPELNVMTDCPGNRILNKLGLSLLAATVEWGSYQAPDPKKAFVDDYHFRHMICRFYSHVTKGEQLSAKEEACLKKLGVDSTSFLLMEANGSASYRQLMSIFADIIKTAGIPQVCESCPVRSPKDRLLLTLGAEVYKSFPNPDVFLPYLIKDNPGMTVVQNHTLVVKSSTADKEEWISTGLYLSPGMNTYLALPTQIVNKGWKVQIGCQTDNLNRLEELKRAACVHETFRITSQMMQVWNLWGGLIYLVAPPNTQVEGAEVTVQMAVLAPYYKSGVTTPAEWAVLRTAPAPWAELEFDNIILTIPSSAVRSLERPDEVAALWDDIMRGIADLAVIPHKLPRKERFVADVQISHGWMHAGYPIMMYWSVVPELVDPEAARSKGIWGFIHELGHNQQRGCWEFPSHTTECTCNLWSVYVHEEVLGLNRAKAHPQLILANRQNRVKEYVERGRDLSDWNVWTALETYLQLQEAFGWSAFKQVFAAYHDMASFPEGNKGKMNLYAQTFSYAVEKNLTGFFRAWGWPIESATDEKVSSLPLWSDHPMVPYE